MTPISEFHVSVVGRPAPQGSKERGPHGQLLESSPYLAPWRAAVKRACYERYKALGIAPRDPRLPLFDCPVAFGVTFWLDTGQRIDSPPDLDKLLRSTWDALSAARAWKDDGRVVEILWATKLAVTDKGAWPPRSTGADITIRQARS